MLSNEIKKVVMETQDLVLAGLKNEEFGLYRTPGWVDAVRQISETPDELLCECLGSTGKRLKQFAVRVKLDHPDLELFFDFVGKAGDLYRMASDIVRDAKLRKETGKDVENEEDDLLAKNANFSYAIRTLQQPRTRLLRDWNDRQQQRSAKRQVKAISLKSAFTGGENAYYSRPDNFKRFARNSKYYIQEMHELAERQACFQRHSMNELAHVYGKRMRSLEESVGDTCGFYKLRPDEAAVILAKMHRFYWHEPTISVTSKFFDGFQFWSENVNEVGDDPQLDTLKKTLVLQTKVVPNNTVTFVFSYQPRMYPLAHFPVSLPEKAQKIINKIEMFNGFNNCPFFDYYWVLVPGVNINHQVLQRPTKDYWTLRINDNNKVYTNATDAASDLDYWLVRQGRLVPVVIGERDGRCFYICLFA